MKRNKLDGFTKAARGAMSSARALRIEGSVGGMTKSIHFDGDVIINGSVCSGVRIFSGGSVFVRDNVEGAVIEAAKDIWVNLSVNGMNKALLKAEGDVRCKFLQDCAVKSGGSVYALSALRCDISSGGDLELTGLRASLISGRVVVGGKIIARVIGAPSYIENSATKVTLSGLLEDGASSCGYIESGLVCEGVHIRLGAIPMRVREPIVKSRVFMDAGEIKIAPMFQAVLA